MEVQPEVTPAVSNMHASTAFAVVKFPPGGTYTVFSVILVGIESSPEPVQ